VRREDHWSVALAKLATTSPLTGWRAPDSRDALLRAAVRVERVTVSWMAVEAAVAIGAGIVARSVLLTAFGVDSLIELVSGGVLLWRLATEARAAALERVEWAERRAAWVAAIALIGLCGYILTTSGLSLVTRGHADASLVGIGLALVAVMGMPVLAWRKCVLAGPLGSTALRGDAACCITCAYLAATLLIGLTLNALVGWWWADSLAALVLLYWLVPETREALEGARTG
jgi:divalent metal cation (Fe/Co/Zn/Cd) transporter